MKEIICLATIFFFGICNFAREIVLGKEKPNYWLEASQIIYHIERLSKALPCDNDTHETDDDAGMRMIVMENDTMIYLMM